ncbi:hypothetical protein D1O30_19580 [Methylocystis hirsuta]|uniref:Uncharacterized protein n=2 Tax=Methylocystis hirsuta TaxID=369798 RepID=A0A3M9XJC1_9HYPH|nr:hypothetical protein D1O30_19580 [Methylocystis hirsuta]
MEAMTRKKDPLEHVEDAIIDSILRLSGDQLDDELRDAGIEPNDALSKVDAAIERGILKAGKANLERARAQLALVKSGLSSSLAANKRTTRERFEKIRSGKANDSEPIMMAARKGEELSKNDIEGLLEDLAELDQLEDDDSRS